MLLLNEILVFKTSVTSPQDAGNIIELLLGMDGVINVNLDLDDCDNILRVESPFNT